MELLPILGQAFLAGLVLSLLYTAGAFVFNRKEGRIADFIERIMASSFMLFIAGFWLDLVAYLSLA
jgi:hypothetical protein